jgi:hypothetical protein
MKKREKMETANIILAVGYVLAVPPLLQIVKALKHPNGKMFKTGISWRVALGGELIGAILITVGWVLRGNVGGWLINGVWSIIFSVLWLRAEAKHKND